MREGDDSLFFITTGKDQQLGFLSRYRTCCFMSQTTKAGASNHDYVISRSFAMLTVFAFDDFGKGLNYFLGSRVVLEVVPRSRHRSRVRCG